MTIFKTEEKNQKRRPRVTAVAPMAMIVTQAPGVSEMQDVWIPAPLQKISMSYARN
jgi:hypothetical protein